MVLIRLMIIAVIRTLLLFVQKERYEKLVHSILLPEKKHDGFDLQGWSYVAVPSGDGVRVHRFYRIESSRPDAPVLLLLHGLNLDGRTYMRFAGLADRFTLVAYDFPEDNSWYTGCMNDYVIMLTDFMQVMGYSSVHLAGTSFGGMVAQALAADLGPQKILSMALISTGISGYQAKERERNRSLSHLGARLEDWQIAWIIDSSSKRFASKTAPDDRPLLWPLFRLKGIPYYRQLTACLRTLNGRECARNIKSPVIVLHGMYDTVMPVIAVRIFRRLLTTEAEFVIIPGAGHAMVFLNGNQVSALVADFALRHTNGAVESHSIR